MSRHAAQPRLLVGMLATLVLLACAPAHADEQAAAPKDTKTQSSPKKDGAKQETPVKEDTEQAAEDAAPSKGGQCTGKATFCGVYSSVFCNSQPGCSYSYSTNRCMGLAMECTKATNAAFCEKIKGCSWK
ncbi:hypothetical protein VZQ01_00520 [Myxococcus faecalis]|uniref:hypothetical protein n=1 Tax=Myxococcus TaxID=32 RepID=UPI0011420D5A|nr:hypothetical protein [Myxococcus sp. AB025B]